MTKNDTGRGTALRESRRSAKERMSQEQEIMAEQEQQQQDAVEGGVVLDA